MILLCVDVIKTVIVTGLFLTRDLLEIMGLLMLNWPENQSASNVYSNRVLHYRYSEDTQAVSKCDWFLLKYIL